MKRPLGIIGLTYLFALMAVNFVGTDYSIWIFILAAIVLIVSISIKKLRQCIALPVCCFVVLAAVTTVTLTTNYIKQPIQQLSGKELFISATILDNPKVTTQGYTYTINVNNVVGEPAKNNFKMYLYTDFKLDCTYYDNIVCTATANKAANSDIDNYYSSNGVYITGSLNSDFEYKISSTNKPIMYYPLSIRDSLAENIKDIIPPQQAGLCSAILLGDKSNLDTSINDDFVASGVSHIITISGLHMAILSSCVYSLFLLFFKRKNASALFTIAIVIGYATVTGFSPSVVRSAITIILILLAPLFTRVPDPITSLGIAALILTIGNPFATYNTGLLLSFFATMGIILLHPYVSSWLISKIDNRGKLTAILKPILITLSVSLCAVIFTFPITLFSFGSISPYFLLTNLLLTWAIAPLIIFTLLTAILCYIPFLSFLAYGFGFLSAILARYMELITAFVSGLPFASVQLGYNFVYIWCIITFSLLIVCIFKKFKKKLVRASIIVSIFVLILGSITENAVSTTTVILHTIPCGSGITAVLEYQNKLAVVAAYGDYNCKNDVIKEISALDKNVDYIISNTEKKDKYDFSIDILEKFQVATIFLCNERDNMNYSDYSANCIDVPQYSNYTLWDKVNLSLYKTENSVWVYLSLGNSSIVICPSDGNFYVMESKYTSAALYVARDKPRGFYNVNMENAILFDNIQDKNLQCSNTFYVEHNTISTVLFNGNVYANGR